MTKPHDAYRDTRRRGLAANMRLWCVARQLLESIVGDLRHGIRALAKNPGFSAVVVLTLALAIGVNSTIFSLGRLVLFPPLPITDPEALVFVRAANPELNRVRAPISLPDFADLRERSTTLEDLAAYIGASFTLTDADEPTRLGGAYATTNLFTVFGLQPLLGRGFSAEEGEPGAARVALLSHGAWERYFGADPSIMGRSITLDGAGHTVIGVLPEELEFGGLRYIDVWIPLTLDPARVPRDQRDLSVIGRLSTGVSVERVREELQAVSVSLQQEFPQTNTGWEARVLSFYEAMVGSNATAVFSLMSGAVLFILIIACANVANLMLARAAARRKELALRQAMGARRGRLVRQLLTESAVLAVLGSLAGLGFADWTLRGLVTLARGGVPLFNEARIDTEVLLFALGLALLTPLLFGVVPALRSTGMNLAAVTGDASRGSSTAGRPGRVLGSSSSALATLQVALAVVLLVVASLAMRTVIALVTIDLGFDGDNVLTLRVDLPTPPYSEGPDATSFFDRALTSIEAAPGVERGAWTSHLPLAGGEPNQSIAIEGRPASSEADVPWVATVTVSPGFFETLRIPLLRGRPLTSDDKADSRPTALVSEAAMQRYWAGGDPVGDRVKPGGIGSDSGWLEVVGVVADIRNPDADQPPEPHLYLPQAQNPLAGMALVARTRGDASLAVDEVRRAIWSVDADQPIDEVRTMGQVLYDDFSGDISTIGLVVFFAVVALVLASAGVYAVISYSVSRRGREIGIRMALGARKSKVLTMIVSQGLAPVILGLFLGLAGGLVMSRLMAGMLYGVGPNDPVTFFGVPALLATVGVVASLVPAIRATRVDPLRVIRVE